MSHSQEPLKNHMLQLEPLSKEAFAPFGDMLTVDGVKPVSINQGMAQSYRALTQVDVTNGTVIANIYQCKKTSFPLQIRMMERHPFGSQAFMPINCQRWLLVVATGDDTKPDDSGFRAFIAQGNQGINYKPGTWHYPLIGLQDDDLFFVVDRDKPEANLQIHSMIDTPKTLDYYNFGLGS